MCLRLVIVVGRASSDALPEQGSSSHIDENASRRQATGFLMASWRQRPAYSSDAELCQWGELSGRFNIM